MRLVDIDKAINRACNRMCGVDSSHCKWSTPNYPGEKCTGVEEILSEPEVEAIPIKWIEEKIKYMKQGCESEAREVIQSLVYWWRVEQKRWR